MSYLSKLNITQLKRPAKASPQEKRRTNLIAKLDEQLALAKAEASTATLRPQVDAALDAAARG